MRARDVRAITFCAVTTLVLAVAALLLLRSFIAALALIAAYDAVLLTRPRMVRVFRRLRGVPDFSVYYDDTGTRFKTSAPETAPSSPRRTGRR